MRARAAVALSSLREGSQKPPHALRPETKVVALTADYSHYMHGWMIGERNRRCHVWFEAT
jgi:hypothetical protein